MERVSDCVLWVPACQQLRIHEATKLDVYCRVLSRAIIEDSSEVGFSLPDSRLSRDEWPVDDFNWLCLDVPSPNWHTIQEPKEKEALRAAARVLT